MKYIFCILILICIGCQKKGASDDTKLNINEKPQRDLIYFSNHEIKFNNQVVTLNELNKELSKPHYDKKIPMLFQGHKETKRAVYEPLLQLVAEKGFIIEAIQSEKHSK
jgi:hypothetical protein